MAYCQYVKFYDCKRPKARHMARANGGDIGHIDRPHVSSGSPAQTTPTDIFSLRHSTKSHRHGHHICRMRGHPTHLPSRCRHPVSLSNFTDHFDYWRATYKQGMNQTGLTQNTILFSLL